MDPTLLAFLLTIGGVTIVPFATFATNLLIQRAKLASVGMKGARFVNLQAIISTAVQAAEQMYRAKKITKEGRKQYAIDTAKKLCKSQGTAITNDILSDLIESAVWEDLKSPAATGVVSPVVSLTQTTETPEILG